MKDVEGRNVNQGDLVQFNEEPPNRELHHRIGTLSEDNSDLHGVVEFRDPPRPGAGREPSVTRVIALWMEVSKVGRARWPEPKRDVVPDLSFPLGGEEPEPPRRRMPSRADMKRLRCMAEALALPAPRDAAHAAGQLRQVGGALASAMCLGDLGSAEANRVAAADRGHLETRHSAMRTLLALAAAEGPPAARPPEGGHSFRVGCDCVACQSLLSRRGAPSRSSTPFSDMEEESPPGGVAGASWGPEVRLGGGMEISDNDGPCMPDVDMMEAAADDEGGPPLGDPGACGGEIVEGGVVERPTFEVATMPTVPLGGAITECLSAQEAMAELRVSDSELQVLVARGDLRVFRSAGVTRFNPVDVRELRSRLEREGVNSVRRRLAERVEREGFAGRVSDMFDEVPSMANPCREVQVGQYLGMDPGAATRDGSTTEPDVDTYIVEMLAALHPENTSPIDLPAVVSGACQNHGARVVSLSNSRGVIVASEAQANDVAIQLRMSCTVRKAR